MLTEANEQALASINSTDHPSLVTSEAHLVGEPEDMIEDELVDDRPLKFFGPQNVDVQTIERQLSGVW
jgi:hypothetical protein